MPAFEWVHVQLHQQKGMISLSPPTICNSALVVTGFDQNNTTTSKAGTFTPANPLFGGSQTGKNERSTLVIIITPTFPSGGNNG
ncbi:hypothetical protein G9D34_004519 [Salmonella enterica]|nr:hypothetical protein [Salmonella enterica subsp. enterica serovar Infantis]